MTTDAHRQPLLLQQHAASRRLLPAAPSCAQRRRWAGNKHYSYSTFPPALLRKEPTLLLGRPRPVTFDALLWNGCK